MFWSGNLVSELLADGSLGLQVLLQLPGVAPRCALGRPAAVQHGHRRLQLLLQPLPLPLHSQQPLGNCPAAAWYLETFKPGIDLRLCQDVGRVWGPGASLTDNTRPAACFGFGSLASISAPCSSYTVGTSDQDTNLGDTNTYTRKVSNISPVEEYLNDS